MLPFIYIFGLKLPMYGLMMITGAFLAVLLACLGSEKRGVNRLDVVLASVFCLICGLLGAKLLFIITRIPYYIEHSKAVGFSFSWLMQQFANSGIVFYGGLIGGVFGAWLFMRIFRLDFWKHADAMLPFLPLAHGFGRIGCFCAGCCYGRSPAATDPEWVRSLAVTYKDAIGAPNGVPLYPVQLFEAFFLILILFPALWLFVRKERKQGQVVGLYFLLYGIFRFLNEYLRNDAIRGIFGGFSTSQWISIVLIPLGVVLLSGVVSTLLASRRKAAGYLTEETDDVEDEYCCAVCTYCGECGRKFDTQRDDEAAEPTAHTKPDGDGETENN